MERTADHGTRPPVGRCTIVDGLNVVKDLRARRVGCVAVIAQEEHEWLTESRLDHAAMRSAIDVDAGLATWIIVAELRCNRSSKRVTEYSHARHVEPTGKLSGRVLRV